ncbi:MULTISPECIES: Uma2 family endonuclease [Streptomyces]|nr:MULTISPECIES: Uma2 family endonuclease [Streptomyces]KOG71123.1 hypothetical protein ADK78_26455 [Kitasatospora aureofaciens]KEF02983.1 hypothetical protein DF17_31355 [Streptomyces rimosus]KEF18612.1 hypothetical protein DF18_21950 [Streptomyces rimosus]KOT33557.1 hypothetical protein ADK84_25945 [Streptomyces sp. NRRL WC-3701]KOT34325.1 hypothetical protein ADK42_22630 [Streptomyces rimosus subsp. rimosus]
MSTDRRLEKATPETWMSPPGGRWTYDQVKDLELPFDWELMDGAVVVRGMAEWWHDQVRDELFFRLKQLKPDPYGVNSERSLLLDAYNSVKPDVVVFDKSGIDVAPLGATPASIVKLVVEVVSPGSQVRDRSSKPFLYAEAGIPYFWRVEHGEDDKPVVHEFWLRRDVGEYVPAPEHPRHTEKLETDRPFPIGIDLASLLEL